MMLKPRLIGTALGMGASFAKLRKLNAADSEKYQKADKKRNLLRDPIEYLNSYLPECTKRKDETAQMQGEGAKVQRDIRHVQGQPRREAADKRIPQQQQQQQKRAVVKPEDAFRYETFADLRDHSVRVVGVVEEWAEMDSKFSERFPDLSWALQEELKSVAAAWFDGYVLLVSRLTDDLHTNLLQEIPLLGEAEGAILVRGGERGAGVTVDGASGGVERVKGKEEEGWQGLRADLGLNAGEQEKAEDLLRKHRDAFACLARFQDLCLLKTALDKWGRASAQYGDASRELGKPDYPSPTGTAPPFVLHLRWRWYAEERQSPNSP